MKIAIYSKKIDSDFIDTFKILVNSLLENNVSLLCYEPFAKYLSTHFSYAPHFCELFTNEQLTNVDMLLSIGGDGTFLNSIDKVVGTSVAVLGINTGRLGFLANVSANEVETLAKYITTGNYIIACRDLLSLKYNNEEIDNMSFALNEVGVLKSATSSLLTMNVYVNNEFLSTYWADGLIVATPTGSTAYSLSGGGPIVSPDCDVLILTPVCPHNLNVRPLLVPSKSKIRIKVESRSNDFSLSMDSKMTCLTDDYELCINLHHQKVNIVILPEYSFYSTLRNKLMWGKDKRETKK